MKTIIISMLLFFVLPGHQTGPHYSEVSGDDFKEGVAAGFKYVIDNIGVLQNGTIDQAMQQAKSALNAGTTVKVQTLEEAVNKMGSSKSAVGGINCYQQLVVGLATSNSLPEFLVALATFELCLDNSGYKSAEASTYITIYRETILMLRDELQYYGRGDEAFDPYGPTWWNSWGRCAVGVIGGAVGGALSGGGGAAIYTGGTGAVFGAAVGFLAGGLTGASRFC